MPQRTGGSGPSERRTHPRSPIVVREARCIAGMEVFFGHAANISPGGLFIATSAPRKRTVGETVEIQFCLPGSDRAIRCRARVAWIRQYRQGDFATPGFGLQFLDLAPEQRAEIEAWLTLQPEGG